MKDDSAEILCQSFQQEALVSSSGTGRYVHSLMLSILHWGVQIEMAPLVGIRWQHPSGWTGALVLI